MGKKVKSISVSNEPCNQITENSVLEGINAGMTASAVDVSVVQMADEVNMKSKIIDADMQKKLDKYDSIFEQNATLLAEKADLESKIASYIEEIHVMKSSEQVDAPVDGQLLENAQNEIESLKSQIAQYLRRISDLTFENATLTAQLKELSTKSAQVQNTVPAMPVRDTQLEKPAYNPYKNNGYASWN